MWNLNYIWSGWRLIAIMFGSLISVFIKIVDQSIQTLEKAKAHKNLSNNLQCKKEFDHSFTRLKINKAYTTCAKY